MQQGSYSVSENNDGSATMACLTLASVAGVGAAQWHKLCSRFNTTFEALAAGTAADLDEGLAVKLTKALSRQQHHRVEASLNWAALSPHHYLLPYTSEYYPPLMRQLPDAPLILFVKGNVKRIADVQLAIVGSRNATRAGIDTTRRFATELAQAGLTITSGMATGVDGAAHQGR
ncbi:DNA-protecting protein DprA [Salinimonas marina]|uniref:DNA-protecting protein DprA n=1 Tax=Salinimonas marina TaxID=2785918 RepID=A0A7S9DXG3_9ALTE|nr:DNA-protecting protein DprA [Salinimonas marina]